MSSMEDPIKMERLEANIKFRRAQSVRRAIRVSLISTPIIYILSNSSWIPYPLFLSSSEILHGFHYFHPTTLQSIISSLWNTDKEVMFFLCNVILLFLIKDSGLIRACLSADDHQFKILVREETHELGSIEDGSGAITVLNEEEVELEEYVECLELVVVDDEAMEVKEVPDEIMDKMYDEFLERFKRERRMEGLQLVVV